MLEFLNAIKEKSATARQRAKEEKEFQEAAKKVNLENDDMLQAAIEATEEKIEEEYGKGVTKKRVQGIQNRFTAVFARVRATNGSKQKVVSVGEASDYLAKSWEYVANFALLSLVCDI